jgi:hypothetical protein
MIIKNIVSLNIDLHSVFTLPIGKVMATASAAIIKTGLVSGFYNSKMYAFFRSEY